MARFATAEQVTGKLAASHDAAEGALLDRMRDRLIARDWPGVIDAATALIALFPDHDIATRWITMMLPRVLRRRALLSICATPDEIENAALTPVEAFLLSRVDGSLSFDSLVDATALQYATALHALVKLVSLRLVEIKTV